MQSPETDVQRGEIEAVLVAIVSEQEKVPLLALLASARERLGEGRSGVMTAVWLLVRRQVLTLTDDRSITLAST